MYTFTDYLDDVSGQYRTTYDNDFQAYAAKPGTNVIDPQNPFRGDPDGKNDWIIYHGIGIKYNLGVSKKTFSAPRLSTHSPVYSNKQVAPPVELPISSADSIPPEKQGNTYNNTYNIQLAENERLDSLEYATRILTWDQEIQKRETKIVNGQVRQQSLLELRKNFDQQFDMLKADETLDPEEKANLLQASEKSIFNLRYSIDSISRREKELKMEIDSISNLKRDLRAKSRVFKIPGFENLNNETKTLGTDSTQSQLPEFKEKSKTNKKPEDEAAIEKSTSKDKKEEAKQEIDQPKKIEQQKTSTTVVTENIATDPQRIARLEEENRYLRYERDRLLIEKNQQQQIPQSKSQRTSTSNQQPLIRGQENIEEPVEKEKKNRWWWPFAAAGGVAATSAILSDDDKNQDPIISQDSIALREAEKPVLSASIETEKENIPKTNISPALVIDPSQKQLAPLDSMTSTYKPLQPVIEKVIVRDTIYVESDSIVNILDSKENIYFKTNQRIPEVEEINKIVDLVSFVKNNEGYGLVLTGFADNTGNVNYNLKLAAERMKNVGSIILDKFEIPQEKIRYESGGQVIRGTMKVSNDLDRRVEVRAEKLLEGEG